MKSKFVLNNLEEEIEIIVDFSPKNSISMCNFVYIHTVKFIYIFGLLLLVFSCSLNGAQEKSLNEAEKAYVKARNNGDLISYTSYVHPNALAYYKNKGDQDFIDKFSLTGVDDAGVSYLQDGKVLDTESKGNEIHVKFEYLNIVDMIYEVQANAVDIYAVSMDDGTSWHFLDGEDYHNNGIIKSENRLIKE
jgi:hypothetical protein